MNFMTRLGITAIPIIAIISILQGCGSNNGIAGTYENGASTLTLKNDGTFTYRLYNTEYDGTYSIEGETIVAKENKTGHLSKIAKDSKNNNILCLTGRDNSFHSTNMCWNKK